MGGAQVLRDALARMDGGRLWFKGGATDDWSGDTDVRRCAAYTLNKLGADQAACQAAWLRAEAVVAAEYPDRLDAGCTLASFNDHPDTTFDDIRVVFEKAALLEDEAEGGAS